MDASPSAITVALLLAAVGLKITDFVKYLVSAIRDRADATKRTEALNGLLTLTVTAVLGVLVVQFFLKNSAWGDEVKIGDELLKDLDFHSTVIFGVVFSALASTLYDFKKAVDNQDDAQKPKLLD